MRTKKKLLTPREVISTLTSEYPELLSFELKVVKQFSSPDGRRYNVFLIEAQDSPWKRFVAKSFWFEGYDLADEVRMLEILKKKGVNAALPILPYKEGNEFLLLRFIEGQNARDALTNSSNVEDVYAKIGATLREIYSVKVPGFGKFWKDGNLMWADYVAEKFSERLSPLIEKDLIPGITEIYDESTDDIERDGAKGPVLIHRDTYTDNFIIEEKTGKAVLIDFAMAIGGRPFFDLAKLYVLDILKEPEGQESFLRELGIERGESELRMLKTFTVIELMGMIGFYKSTGESNKRKFSEKTLSNIVHRRGTITEILNAFMN